LKRKVEAQRRRAEEFRDGLGSSSSSSSLVKRETYTLALFGSGAIGVYSYRTMRLVVVVVVVVFFGI